MMSIEYEDVADAAAQLKEDGIEPSTRNVQAVLGGKSHSYIAPYLGLWHRRRKEIEDASELPEAFLEEAKLLALGMWSMARDRADLREELLLREIERLTGEAAQREADYQSDGSKMKQKEVENEAKKKAQTDEIAELKRRLSQEEERAAGALAAQRDAETARAEVENRTNSYMSTIQSSQEKDKETSASAIARVAQLEFENKGLKEKVEDAEALRSDEAARFDTLFQSFMEQQKVSSMRKSRAAKPPPDNA